MPVPKRKRSRARRDKRFANKGLKVQSFSSCSQCNEPLLPHIACKKCGHYKGVKVLRTKGDRWVARAEEIQKKEATQKQVEASKETESPE